MCYTGVCQYETYPNGINEGCECTKPMNEICFLEEMDEFQYENNEEE